MNRRIDLFDLFVWAVRLILFVVLVGLLFACAINYATTSANPVCLVSCTAPASPAASGVVIEQTIQHEGKE